MDWLVPCSATTLHDDGHDVACGVGDRLARAEEDSIWLANDAKLELLVGLGLLEDGLDLLLVRDELALVDADPAVALLLVALGQDRGDLLAVAL